MSNTEVIKARGCIHISHQLSLVQQQLWNLLLSQAYNNLLIKKEHVIPESMVREYLGNTRNQKHLKNIIMGLQVQVHYNILHKDGNKWGFFSLLSYAEIENGVCRYAFVDELRPLLHNPRFYAKISLVTQKNFRSKYALFLYELCVDYGGVAQTPWISIREFRQYMGLGDGEYPGFKSLRQHIIDKAVTEINDCSDISIAVDYKKGGRWITDIKFFITKKECQAMIPESIIQAVNDDMVNELISFGIPSPKAVELTSAYPAEQLRDKISLLKENDAKIHNSGAWLIAAIQEDWRSVAHDQQEECNKKETARKENLAKEQQRNQFIETLKKEYDLFLEELAEQRYNALPAQEKKAFEEKFTAWFAEKQTNAFFRFLPKDVCYKAFLSEELIQPLEKNFISWTERRGNL